VRPTARIVAALFVVAQPGVFATPAEADTRTDLERARARVAQVREEADALAEQYEAAQVHAAEVDAELSRTRRAIDGGRARARRLRAIIRQRAVEGYVGGAQAAVPLVFDDSVMDGQRRLQFLALANKPTAEALDDLRVVDEELAIQEDRLVRAHREQEDVVRTLRRAGDALQSKLSDAQRQQDAIEAKYEREEAARRRAEQARRRAEAQRVRAREAASRAAMSGTSGTGESGGGDGVAEPPAPGAAIVCPIQGALSFVDSWGAPRSGGRRHQGVDLMAPFGTPNVAVVSGRVSMNVGDLSGNGVYLYGDDGNTYYYFHLQSWAGGPRQVAQGELVGYVGDTGNARGGPPHTHFEFHPGGGPAVNPYPIVRDAC
jgi:murein DD-endopeptidase MepM/ murein hydrolase activator NlpD